MNLHTQPQCRQNYTSRPHSQKTAAHFWLLQLSYTTKLRRRKNSRLIQLKRLNGQTAEGPDRLLSLFSVSWMGVMRQAWSEDKRAVFYAGWCRSTTDLEQFSKLYGQPMKGMKQWRTASKWRRLCPFWTCWSLVRSMLAIPYRSELQ